MRVKHDSLTSEAPRLRVRGALRLLIGFCALVLIAGAGAFGYFWPQEARAMVRWASDPLVIARVETHGADIRFAAQESGLDPSLLAAIVYTESSGRLDAVSSADALGLMQLRPEAAHDAAGRLEIEEPGREQLLSDGGLNLRLGASHFAWILEHEGGDVERSLLAYNAGRTRLRRWVREAGSYESWYEVQKRAGDSGVLAYAERVLTYAEVFRERGKIDPSANPSSHENDRLP